MAGHGEPLLCDPRLAGSWRSVLAGARRVPDKKEGPADGAAGLNGMGIPRLSETAYERHCAQIFSSSDGEMSRRGDVRPARARKKPHR
jgi:hypothetical protein